MAKVQLYKSTGEQAGNQELSDAVFGVKVNNRLVHQVYVALEANAREPWADTKDKSEVRGGGRKPWRQKGTGRARHGSIRSPLWRGGGITFGPLSIRNYKQKLNRKMKQQAVRMCLSGKVAEEKMVALEAVNLSGKTKDAAALLAKLPGTGKSTLILTAGQDEALLLSTRNIPKVHVQRAQDVNVVDLMHHQHIIVTADAVRVLEDRLAA